MDIAPDGKKFLLLNYADAMEFFVDLSARKPDPSDLERGRRLQGDPDYDAGTGRSDRVPSGWKGSSLRHGAPSRDTAPRGYESGLRSMEFGDVDEFPEGGTSYFTLTGS